MKANYEELEGKLGASESALEQLQEKLKGEGALSELGGLPAQVLHPRNEVVVQEAGNRGGLLLS